MASRWGLEGVGLERAAVGIEHDLEVSCVREPYNLFVGTNHDDLWEYAYQDQFFSHRCTFLRGQGKIAQRRALTPGEYIGAEINQAARGREEMLSSVRFPQPICVISLCLNKAFFTTEGTEKERFKRDAPSFCVPLGVVKLAARIDTRPFWRLRPRQESSKLALGED